MLMLLAGLLLALLLGKRKENRFYKPSSIKLFILGSALLGFGWFGAGSQLAADGIAAELW
jgi:Amt family ammonium transporter